MAIELTDNSPGLTDVPGLRAGAGSGDIRRKGQDRLDTALIVADRPSSAAGVFTTNDIKAAPVRHSQAVLAASASAIRGFVANSGNANACTGEQGMRDAEAMSRLAGEASGYPGEAFLVCSTGRIGEPLPMEHVAKGTAEAGSRLAAGATEGERTSWAILTSDTRPKSVTARFSWEGRTLTIAGIAKGAGMIEPNMATMLAFVATDLAASPSVLRAALLTANAQSFNCVSVDGDMSTNDTVLLLATGASGLSLDGAPPALTALFQEALDRVCFALAEKIVGDGEKITKVVSVEVSGARNRAEAEAVARAVGNSLLVKSAWYGEDPNWGRLADAAGYARIGLDEARLDISYDDVPAVVQGRPLPENKPRWKEVVTRRRFAVRINLNLGPDSFRLLTTDLSEAYVNFNKSE
jgi:glutamate N-acetyltransferase/amino-acid N-acetyltransferase